VIQSLLSRQQAPVLISQLTEVEFASALARWVRTGELDESQANRIESAFHEDMSDGRLLLKPVTHREFARAKHWLLTRKTALRTLDALQLACAETGEAELVTLDERMLDAAVFLGLRVCAVEAP
jgi:uncharacterized protein